MNKGGKNMLGKIPPVRHCLSCGKQVLRHDRGYGELRIRKGDFGKHYSKRCYGDHMIAINKQKAALRRWHSVGLGI